MNVNEVIKYPILSEKTYAQMAEKVYTFAVDPRTNRAEVKKTIEFIFEVKVKKVNIIAIDKQPTKLGRSEGFTNRLKKAIVTLSEGVINIFPDEAQADTQSKTNEVVTPTAKTAKSPAMSAAEQKAAAKIAAKTAAKNQAAHTTNQPEANNKTQVEKTSPSTEEGPQK